LYLAVATLALGTAMPQILKHKAFEHWTGGSMGVVIIKPDAPEWTGLNQDQWLYFFTLFWVVVLFFAAWNLLRGRVGRALVAIRDQPIAAQAMGIDTAMYKSLTFGVSALYTGIAGALAAIGVQFASPDSFTVFLSLTLLIGVVVGGLASISGAFYGALFIQFTPNIADQISKAAPWAIYGVFLIGFMYLMPSGVAGLIRIARHRLGARKVTVQLPLSRKEAG
jgi:branched-chain amino acid transport system permease protein